ncbi:MAG: helix-turn-helix transcriptional regulator [Vampirovibrionales bacterium]|nr:helix-turn-helix transcriptional regulator [Vampirovibrionales bacterium]
MGKYRTAFGDLLDDLLYEKGMKSLTEFGERIGVAKNALSQYCTGAREPGDEILIRMALFLDVDYITLKRAALLDRYPLWQLITIGVFDSFLTKEQVGELQSLIDNEDDLEELLKQLHRDLDLQKQYVSVGWKDFLESLKSAGFLHKQKTKPPLSKTHEKRVNAL